MNIVPLLAQNQLLNPAGWTLMIVCVGSVCSLCAFCFWKILRQTDPSEHVHAPLEIDTHDRDD